MVARLRVWAEPTTRAASPSAGYAVPNQQGRGGECLHQGKGADAKSAAGRFDAVHAGDPFQIDDRLRASLPALHSEKQIGPAGQGNGAVLCQ